MKCIDTDFLIAILRGKEDARRKMQELDRESRQATSSVTAFELFYGAYKSSEKTKSVEKVSTLLGRLDVLPLDYESSNRAGEVLASLSEDGKMIDFRDALVAGISMVNSMSLVTRNDKHFSRIRGLEIESW
ncbi:MAG: type II toxin-antitoxin system VapC family toxin [Nitrososphaerales archaeon]